MYSTNARLEEWERMVRDLSEFDEINRLLITRYQEHGDREVDLDDKENKLIGWCHYLTPSLVYALQKALMFSIKSSLVK